MVAAFIPQTANALHSSGRDGMRALVGKSSQGCRGFDLFLFAAVAGGALILMKTGSSFQHEFEDGESHDGDDDDDGSDNETNYDDEVESVGDDDDLVEGNLEMDLDYDSDGTYEDLEDGDACEVLEVNLGTDQDNALEDIFFFAEIE